MAVYSDNMQNTFKNDMQQYHRTKFKPQCRASFGKQNKTIREITL